MKRPVSLVLVASLLVSASALAGNGPAKIIAERLAVRESNDRGNDNRGHENRGGPQRNDDRRGGGNDRRDDRRDHRNDHGNDNNRRDWNDRRDDNRRRDDRNDHRNDNSRRDWNDHRADNRHRDSRNDWNGHRGWDRPRSDWNNHPNYWDNRRHDRRDYARYRYSYGHYRAPRGYHYRVWHRGDHLPRSYYGSSYIVYDWRPYRLYSPPYGYHWVRVGNDVLLTALATGVVLDVIYDIWY